jgi:hypothetical protein
MMNRKLTKIIVTLIFAAILGGYEYFQKSGSTSASAPAISNQQQTLDRIRKAANNQESGWWLTVEGTVIKLLKDDTKGHEHQKFLIKLAPDITLLVAHNTTLAKRVPVKKGDNIKLRARYEWNHRGGVLHWTHHDPKGRKKGGWIYHKNTFYK